MSLETVVPDEASIKSTFRSCGGILLYWNGDNSRQINTKTSCKLGPIHRVMLEMYVSANYGYVEL